MADPRLALSAVSFVLPDGRTLFPPIDFELDAVPTGLVGGNGVGKSVLARIVAGILAPTTGRREGDARVHYLPQLVRIEPGERVAGLMGVADPLAALERIEAGSADPLDFERLGDRWTLRGQLAQALAQAGLPGLDPWRPAGTLSGGEAMRVALAGAWLADADVLVLDEPGNHLDRQQRASLVERLQGWRKGLLLVSHDRDLFDGMQRIVELSPAGLRSYGGNHAFYVRQRAEERAAAMATLEQARLDHQRLQAAQREQHERQQRRQARGNRSAKRANQAPILLGMARARSEASAGRLGARQAEALAQSASAQHEAAAAVDAVPQLALCMAGGSGPERMVVRLERAVLAHVPATAAGLDLALTARQRIGVVGPNGSGKSSLLRVLAGRQAPLSGRRLAYAPIACFDQQLDGLDPLRSTLDNLRRANPVAAEADLRGRLALLGMDADLVRTPCGRLSGGERVRAALACVLYAQTPPSLLLLDEPGNHLELAALDTLERMLAQYRGGLVLVSHDRRLLDAAGLSHRIDAGADAWHLAPW